MSTNTKQLSTLNDGDRFDYGGHHWVALSSVSTSPQNIGGRLCLMAKHISISPAEIAAVIAIGLFTQGNLDLSSSSSVSFGKTNDWRESSVRKFLNGDFLKKLVDKRKKEGISGDIGIELAEYVSDLTADDGLRDYGESTDRVFLLSADSYRFNRYAIPSIYDDWWLITSDTSAADNPNFVRYVVGEYSTLYSVVAEESCYLRPAIYLKSDTLVSVSKK
jgi:hypothetical protein